MQTHETDVLVLGAGLAGIMAAISAAEAGARTTIMASGPICSGSSFCRDTWGLGMALPDEHEKRGSESLSKALEDVGLGMSDPALAKTLQDRSTEMVSRLRSYGVSLRRPEHPGQSAYVPCFDSRNRLWRGFEGSAARGPLVDALARSHVICLDHTTCLALARSGSSVTGALGLHNMTGEPIVVSSGATIVATGGTCGLYQRYLGSPDPFATGQALAVEAGATLVNLEFEQLMIGTESPVRKVVFNEKLLGRAHLTDLATGRDVFEVAGVPADEAREALAIHATHGPFTSRLASSLVELSLARVGSRALVTTGGTEDAAEFVSTYANWYKMRTGHDPEEPTVVCEYAHSSNGGILIDTDTSTGVDGLYACGEAAGGVHGADRIGGLASVSAVTFGCIAGSSAASHAAKAGVPSEFTFELAPPLSGSPRETRRLLSGIRHASTESLMVVRTDEGTSHVLEMCDAFEHACIRSSEAYSRRITSPVEASLLSREEIRDALMASHAKSFVKMTRALAKAMRMRTESRGSHYRDDRPACDEHMARRILVRDAGPLDVDASLEGMTG